MLADPTHGAVSFTGTSFGDIASFSCNSGYEIVGVANLSCGYDGSWSDNPATCRGKFNVIHISVVKEINPIFQLCVPIFPILLMVLCHRQGTLLKMLQCMPVTLILSLMV